MKYVLCEYAINKSTPIKVNVRCSKTGQVCGMIRWCTNQRAVRMNDFYDRLGCKIKDRKVDEK